MCFHCVRKAKHLGRPKTVKPGLIRHLANCAMRHQAWPIFSERAANCAVEAEIYRIERARTRRRRDELQGNRQNDDH